MRASSRSLGSQILHSKGAAPTVFALEQCDKAINLLRSNTLQHTSTPVMLISCVFLMVFGLLQDNIEISFNQLRCTWSILNMWTNQKRQYATSSERELVDEYLTPMIIRFSESCDPEWFRLNTPAMYQRSRQMMLDDASVPYMFLSLNRVSSSLHEILDSMFPRLSVCRDNGPMDKVCCYNMFQVVLYQWWNKYQDFLRTPGGSSSTIANLRHMALLEIHYYCAVILCAARFSDDEMVYDQYTSAFSKILQLCQRVIQLENQNASLAEPRMTVSFDLGIMMPLYFTGCRCRDPFLRREVSRLLKSSPCREGIWLSWMTGTVIEHVTKIEETGLCNPASCADIPLGNRIEFSQLHFNPGCARTADGSKLYRPKIRIGWVSVPQKDGCPQITQWKTIQLAATMFNWHGQRPYCVLIPRSSEFSDWRLLLGRKIFGAQAEILLQKLINVTR